MRIQRELDVGDIVFSIQRPCFHQQLGEHLMNRHVSSAAYGSRDGCLFKSVNARRATPVAEGAAPEDPIANAVRAPSTWASLIYKVYEVDPLISIADIA